MAKLVNARTREQHLMQGKEVILGRHPSCHIRVLEKQVSRQHCFLARTDDGWVLRDSGSMLGTMLNGELLIQPQCLQSGDQVKVGTEVYTFHDDPIDRTQQGLMLRPLSEALPEELVPMDTRKLRPRWVPVGIGLGVAALAIAGVAALLLAARETPAKVIYQAASLLRQRQAGELWHYLSNERKRTITLEEFQEQVKAVPDKALDALNTLVVGTIRRSERGMVVSVTVQVGDERISDDVVLFREDGHWRIHSAPTERLAQFESPAPPEP